MNMRDLILSKRLVGASGGGSATVKNQHKVITENGVYKADSGYTGLGTVTVNVAASGDSGGDFDALIDRSITEVDSGVTQVGANAFSGCKALTSVNLPNATKIGDSAFRECTAMSAINLPSVTNLDQNAFHKCSALKTVNIPKIDIIGDYAFQACSSLEIADFPSATTLGKNALNSCVALKAVNFPNIKSLDYSAFQRCYALTTASFQNVTQIGNYAVADCTYIQSVDFHKATSIGSCAFQNCLMLKAVILRSETVCTLSNTDAFKGCFHILGTTSSSYNPNGDMDGYFYVPRVLVDSYKSATNWSTYASQIRALEDYTVDGTITGALDPSKI